MELNTFVCGFAAAGWLIATACFYRWWSAVDDLKANQNSLAALERDHRELVAMCRRREFLAAKLASSHRPWGFAHQSGARSPYFEYGNLVDEMLIELAKRGDPWAVEIAQVLKSDSGAREQINNLLDEWIASEKGVATDQELVA